MSSFVKSMLRMGMAALVALAFTTACKKVEKGPKIPTDLDGWILYTTTDGEEVNFWSDAEANRCIDDYGYAYYDETKGVRYLHLKDIPEDFSYGFFNWANLKTIDLSHVDFSHCTKMDNLFYMTAVEKVVMSGLDLSSMKSMEKMFLECENLKEVKMDGLDISNVESLAGMFEGCTGIETVDFSGVKSNRCSNIYAMFFNCRSLKSYDLGPIGKYPLEATMGMFNRCTSLETIDLSGMNFAPHDNPSSSRIYAMLSYTTPSVVKIPASLTTDMGMASALYGVESDGILYYPKGTDPLYALANLQRDGHKWKAVEY